jgi:hypothetical protein
MKNFGKIETETPYKAIDAIIAETDREHSIVTINGITLSISPESHDKDIYAVYYLKDRLRKLQSETSIVG